MTGSVCANGCGRTTKRPVWPGGALCFVCANGRVRRHGLCPSCGFIRSLPGGIGDAPMCATCGGITESLVCRTCGADDDFRSLGRCRRCSLRTRLDRLFDDGTGRVNPTLVPLVDALGAMEVPRGGISWLSRQDTSERIRAIATGEIPLTHEGLDTLAMSNGREHLRELLITHGVLPERDRYLAAYERWAKDRVASVTEPADRRLITAYLRWHHGPRMARFAEAGELTESRYSVVRAQTNIAVRLLAWLRARGTDLVTCTQGDIDTWFATGPSTRLHSRSFLSWAIRTHRRPTLRLPPDRHAAPRPMPEGERLDLLSRFLLDEDVDLEDRVAGCLVVLYALPISRINRLATGDFEPVDGGLALRISDDLVPVPAPLAALIGRLAERRRNVTGAGHPDSDWLFPGGRAGQPIEPDQLALRLNRLGVTRAARTAALDALLATVPAPVLAKLLDRKPWRVAERSKLLGTDWRNYVALRVQL
jgi:integrase